MGKYLYCIIPCSEERAFESVAPVGGAGGSVYTIPHDGLALVVSDSPVNELETTRVNMVAHERVVESVLKQYALLPVRFGTVAGPSFGLEDLHRLLQRRSQEFHGLLGEVQGRVELGVKALWKDSKAVFEEVVHENPPIRRLRDSLSNKPPHVARYPAMELGEMVKTALEAKRKKEAAALLGQLKPIAHTTRENPQAGDRMVLNAAFLVDMAREKEFDQAVERCEKDLESRLTFKYVGPVPPYNFVSIVVNWREL